MTPEYLDVPCISGETLRIKVRGLVYRGRSMHQMIEVFDTWEFGRCLVLDGVIQASEMDHEIYDREILARMRAADRDLLILGGGDGYVAAMAVSMTPALRVTIVDLDREVAEVSGRYLSQGVFDHPGVRLIVDDALAYMPRLAPNVLDGLVCDFTDLPVGYDEERFREFYSRILEHAARILKKQAWMSIYAGIHPLRIQDLCARFFSVVQRRDVLVPSFGEPCAIMFCEGRGDSPDTRGGERNR